MVSIYNNFVMQDRSISKIVNVNLFSASVDLTRGRYLLLNELKGLIKDCESINYVCADVNCSLGMKFQNGVFKYFHSEETFCKTPIR